MPPTGDVSQLAIEDTDLYALMIRAGATPEMARDIVNILQVDCKLRPKTQSFLSYFKHRDLYEWFKEVGSRKHTWKDNGELMVALDTAFELGKKEKERAEAADKADSDDEDVTPINPHVNRSLNEIWQLKYGFNLHPSQENWSRKLHSMWKKLKNRTGQAETVMGLVTLEDEPRREAAGSDKRKFQWGSNFELVDKTKAKNANEAAYYARQNPWLWLTALDAQLRTFCKAGTFYVDDPQSTTGASAKTLMIDREPIEIHLAECRSFVTRWATAEKVPENEEILRQVSRVEMNIRQEWWKLFIENQPPGRTFASCIAETRPFAKQQWKQDFSMLLFPAFSVNRRSWDDEWSQQSGEDEDDEDYDEPEDDYDPEEEQSASWGKRQWKRDERGVLKTIQKRSHGNHGGSAEKLTTFAVWIGDKRVLVTRGSGTQRFCGQWNARGACSYGVDCSLDHKCNVMTNGDTACMGPHPACQHTGRVVEA